MLIVYHYYPRLHEFVHVKSTNSLGSFDVLDLGNHGAILFYVFVHVLSCVNFGVT